MLKLPLAALLLCGSAVYADTAILPGGDIHACDPDQFVPVYNKAGDQVLYWNNPTCESIGSGPMLSTLPPPPDGDDDDDGGEDPCGYSGDGCEPPPDDEEPPTEDPPVDEPDEDHDNGHGNDEDGHDESNPGKGPQKP
jgi:hypothetical protein